MRGSKKDSWLIGVGLDDSGGHKRLTKGKRFVIIGGSGKTHEKLTEKAIRIENHLRRKGKSLADLDPREFIETYLEDE